MKPYDLVLTYNWGSMDAVMGHTLFGDALKLPPLIHHEDGFNEDEQKKLKTKRNWFRRVALGKSAALVVPSEQLEEIALEVWYQPMGPCEADSQRDRNTRICEEAKTRCATRSDQAGR